MTERIASGASGGYLSVKLAGGDIHIPIFIYVTLNNFKTDQWKSNANV
jgi:nucleoside-specific outer membrane channel protein Tsx